MKRRNAISVLGLAGVLGAALLSATPAAARNCYDGLTGDGCPWKTRMREADLQRHSCQNLAHIRNQLYHENGYCFRTEQAKAQYGNQGCKWPIQQLVPLNATERSNIALIRKVERSKRCG